MLKMMSLRPLLLILVKPFFDLDVKYDDSRGAVTFEFGERLQTMAIDLLADALRQWGRKE